MGYNEQPFAWMPFCYYRKFLLQMHEHSSDALLLPCACQRVALQTLHQIYIVVRHREHA
jgi:hypothetical protein